MDRSYIVIFSFFIHNFGNYRNTSKYSLFI